MNIDKTIYLCGPIHGRNDHDCRWWREVAKDLWHGRCLDPMDRDYRGREQEMFASIVPNDLKDIDNSDGLLVYFDKPSVGTSMEIFYARHVRRLPVVVVDALGAGRRNPWMLYHSSAMVGSVGAAVHELAHQLTRNRA